MQSNFRKFLIVVSLFILPLLLVNCGNPLGGGHSRSSTDFHPGAPSVGITIAPPPPPGGLSIGSGSEKVQGVNHQVDAKLNVPSTALKAQGLHVDANLRITN